jgi:hypothetical protein
MVVIPEDWVTKIKLEHITRISNNKNGKIHFILTPAVHILKCVRLCLKCDGTCAQTRFRLSAKRTSPFKSAGWASVQSTNGSRGVRISGSNAGCTMFRGSVKSTGYPLHSPVSPSLPHPCVTICHHISTGLYPILFCQRIFHKTILVWLPLKQVTPGPTPHFSHLPNELFACSVYVHDTQSISADLSPSTDHCSSMTAHS